LRATGCVIVVSAEVAVICGDEEGLLSSYCVVLLKARTSIYPYLPAAHFLLAARVEQPEVFEAGALWALEAIDTLAV
jgi:hypothetical protein